MTMGTMSITTAFQLPTIAFTGERRVSPRICVTIEAGQKRWLDRQCRHEHRTQSEIVRLALRLYYEGKDEFGRPNPAISQLL